MINRASILDDTAERALTHETARLDAAGRGEIDAAHFDGNTFCDFVEAHFHDVPKRGAAPQPFRFRDWQRDQWRQLLRVEGGELAHSTIGLNWPRRHGKSQQGGYYDLARCLCYPNQVVVIQGNSADQGAETVFEWILNTLSWSPCFGAIKRGRRPVSGVFHADPAFREMAPKLTWSVVGDSIHFSNGSVIRVASFSESSSYGKRISVYHNTELCRAPNRSVFDVGASSTGDSWCGVTLVDSNMGDEDQLVCQIARSATLTEGSAAMAPGATRDPSTIVSYIAYDSLADCTAQGLAPWLEEAWLRSRMVVMTPGEFRRNHLNRATGAGESVFAAPLVRLARTTEVVSRLICDVVVGSRGESWTSREALAAIRRRYSADVMIGFGLDRSEGGPRSDNTCCALWGMARDRQRTLGEATPLYDDRGEVVDMVDADARVVFPLALAVIPAASEGEIKRFIRRAAELYGDPWSLRFERYQAMDLSRWAEDHGFDRVALTSLTDATKHDHVRRWCELLATERMILPARAAGGAALLLEEIPRYAELPKKAGQVSSRFPKYGGRRGVRRLDLRGDGDLQECLVKDDMVEASFQAIAGLLGDQNETEGGFVFTGEVNHRDTETQSEGVRT